MNLQAILASHARWTKDLTKGERADLRWAGRRVRGTQPGEPDGGPAMPESRILLRHFPWSDRERRPYPPWTVLLHGHTHSRGHVSGPASINMSTEAWKYASALLEDVLEIAEELKNV